MIVFTVVLAIVVRFYGFLGGKELFLINPYCGIDCFGVSSYTIFASIFIQAFGLLYGISILEMSSRVIYNLKFSDKTLKTKIYVNIIKKMSRHNLTYLIFTLIFSIIIPGLYFIPLILGTLVYAPILDLLHAYFVVLYLIINFIYLDSTYYTANKIKDEFNKNDKLKSSIEKIFVINIIVNYLLVILTFLLTFLYYWLVYILVCPINNNFYFVIENLKVSIIIFLVLLGVLSIMTHYNIKKKRKILQNKIL